MNKVCDSPTIILTYFNALINRSKPNDVEMT